MTVFSRTPIISTVRWAALDPLGSGTRLQGRMRAAPSSRRRTWLILHAYSTATANVEHGADVIRSLCSREQTG